MRGERNDKCCVSKACRCLSKACRFLIHNFKKHFPFLALAVGITLTGLYHMLLSAGRISKDGCFSIGMEISSYILTVWGGASLLFLISRYLKKISKIAQKVSVEMASVKEVVTNSAIWWHSEQSQKIPVNVSNMDDYIIHLPYILAHGNFKAENLEIKTENCLTDTQAIQNVVDHGGIAIANPHFVSNVQKG